MHTKKIEDNVFIKDQILESLDHTKPAYMVKYKGQMFGYYPADIRSIEDCIAIHLMQHKDQWRTLAAILFRPVKITTKWVNRKGWTKVDKNTSVKYIDDFHKNLVTYKCKKVDLEKTDLEYWNEFPLELVVANLGFTMGVGLQSGIAIATSSSKQLQEMQKKMTSQFQALLNGLILLQALQNQTSLRFMVETESWISLQDKYSTTSLLDQLKISNEKQRLTILEMAQVLGGNSFKITTEAIIKFYESFIEGNAEIKHIKAMGMIGDSFAYLKKSAITKLFK